ncbi:MAG: nitronate monooxygenase [Jatrophihabitantaceae bacterium]
MLPIELPIVQAPMAGGTSTRALAAAVANAGGLGFVAGGYLTADALRDAIAATRALTGGPLGVNLFVPSTPGDPVAIARYADELQPEANRLGVALGEPRWEDDAYQAKLDVVVATAPQLAGFTFGCPATDVVERLHGAGSQVAVTVTGAAEARQAQAAGVDLLIVQGTEAGGHQGGFDDCSPNLTPLLHLLAELRDTTPLPLIASGGVMDSAGLAAALGAGAVAAQLGTALLCTPEAGTSAVHRRALLDGAFDETAITRAYSGRYGRGLRNRLAREHPDAPRAYPEVHHLTRPLRAAATAAGDPEVPNLWAGTGWRSITARPAAQVVRTIAGRA